LLFGFAGFVNNMPNERPILQAQTRRATYGGEHKKSRAISLVFGCF